MNKCTGNSNQKLQLDVSVCLCPLCPKPACSVPFIYNCPPSVVSRFSYPVPKHRGGAHNSMHGLRQPFGVR